MGSTWNDDSVQFPRLITEMEAGLLTNTEDFLGLCNSMDLTGDELRDLLDRAQKRWDRIKANTADGAYLVGDEYNEDLDYNQQAAMEQRVADYVFHVVDKIGKPFGPPDLETACGGLAGDVLAMVLKKFRPDLFECEP